MNSPVFRPRAGARVCERPGAGKRYALVLNYWLIRARLDVRASVRWPADTRARAGLRAAPNPGAGWPGVGADSGADERAVLSMTGMEQG
jgi:hypothetical protein